ncbi:RNA-binding S4 domain-containing protein [Arcanobacterium canis]
MVGLITLYTVYMDEVRIDVWLWSVRQIKTRSQATAAVRAGHVRINDLPVKPATKVSIGDIVKYRVEGFDRILKVTALLKKRVGAPIAVTAYEDLTPQRPRVVLPVAKRDPGMGRPTKRERRELDRLFGRDPNAGRRR